MLLLTPLQCATAAALPARPNAVIVCVLQGRVFRQYVEELLEGLRDGRFFGVKAQYLLYVIEFQKYVTTA